MRTVCVVPHLVVAFRSFLFEFRPRASQSSPLLVWPSLRVRALPKRRTRVTMVIGNDSTVL